MRLKVPFFGYVLAVFGLVLPSLIFAAFLPSLINTQPVKDRLLSELNEWTGGQVKLAGQITVESYFSLSLKVEDVKIEKFKSLPRLKGLHAEHIIARIAWFDLLLGNLDFDKLKIDGALIKAQISNPRDTAAALLSALSGPHDSPFAAFVLKDTIIAVRETPRKPYRKIQVESATAKVDPASGHIETGGNLFWNGEKLAFDMRTRLTSSETVAARVPLQIKIDSALFTGEFDGDVAISAPWWAEGRMSARTADILRLADRMGWEMPGASAYSFGIAGALSLANERLSLESASISIGSQTAASDLSLSLRQNVPRLQGSLAFDAINLDDMRTRFRQSAGDEQLLQAVNDLLSNYVDIDLLVSAGNMSIDDLKMGRAAFALNSKAGRIFANIAELSPFDGSVRGRVELDFTTAPIHLRARLSGDDLLAGELLHWANYQDWVSGRANANAVLDAKWDEEAQNFVLSSVDARIGFPDGGQMKFDIPQLAEAEAPDGADKWQMAVSNNADFDALRFKLTLRDKMLHCANLELVSGGNFVTGDGQIDLAKQSLDWRLTLASSPNVSAPIQPVQRSGISIQGSWGKPTIRSIKVSGKDLTDSDAKSVLAIEAKESLADVR